MNTARTFDINAGVLALGLTGVYFTMTGLDNRERDAEFDLHLNRTVPNIMERYESKAAIKDDPILQGFRDLHTAVGRSNRDNVSSPESLLTALQRGGNFPRINLLVDIYNLVSLQTRLALGAHDLATTDGDIHLTFTTGEELFVPIGGNGPKPIHPGEYAYVDDSNEVICRLETRQVEKTKVTLDTKDAFYIVQGNAATSPPDVWSAATSLIELTKRYCGGEERILYAP